MNKYQASLERILGGVRYEFKSLGTYELDELTLKELVDKATPKRFTDDHCPNCKQLVGYHHTFNGKLINENGYLINNCPRCGQAIDWSEQ
jgi:phage FluMu protein Com